MDNSEKAALRSYLTSISEAINEVNGTNVQIQASDFPTQIRALSASGGTSMTISDTLGDEYISSNGTTLTITTRDTAQTISGNKTFSGILAITGTLSNGTYSYTLPSTTGTLALTSNTTPRVSSTTNNAIVRFDGTTGAIKNSVITVSDSGNLTIGGTWTSASADNPRISMGGYSYITGNTSGAYTFAPLNTPSFLMNGTEFRPISGLQNQLDLGSSLYKFRNGYFATAVYTPVLNNGGSITVPTSTGTMALTSDIPSAYIKNASVSNGTLTLTKQDNSTVTFSGGGSGGDLSNVVTLTGNEIISGAKVFSTRPSLRSQATSVVLPTGYTALAFIETSGTQFIDTGVNANGNIKAEADFEMLSIPSSYWAFSGARNGSSNRAYLFGTAGNSNFWGCGYVSNLEDTGFPVLANTRYNAVTVLTAGTQTLTVNGVEIFSKTSNEALATNVTIYIGGLHYSGSSNVLVSAKIYSYKLYVNNTLERNFIPCSRDSDSKLGLYDLEHNVFYPNAGSGEFSAGNNATDSEILVYRDLAPVAFSGSYDDLINKPSTVNEIFWCTYGTTTGEEIAAAISAGKYVACIYNGNIYGNVLLHSEESRYYLTGFYGSYTRKAVRCSTTGKTWSAADTTFLGGFTIDGTSRITSSNGVLFSINSDYDPTNNKMATGNDIYGKYAANNSATELGYTTITTISLSAARTFTFAAAPTSCYPEYRAIITNSGSSVIALTFTGVTNIITNDELNVRITSSNVINLSAGTTIEINCMNNKLVAINWSV